MEAIPDQDNYHAVNVVLEDFTYPYQQGSQPLSQASLLFLLMVDGDDDTCVKPVIVDPPKCRSIRPGEYFEMVIEAESGDSSHP